MTACGRLPGHVSFNAVQISARNWLDKHAVSKPIVMASAAGWYVGKVCKGEFCVEPYDRFTDYFATLEEAQVVLDTPIEDGGFNENFGVVEKEFG